MFSGIGLKLDFRPDISGLDKSIKPYAVSAQRELDGFLSFNIQPAFGIFDADFAELFVGQNAL